jgi:hypothetical protein
VASPLPGAVNGGDLPGYRREAEAIHQQMVITLIPVPAVVADAQQLMAHQRVAAVDPQILRQIRLHPLRGGAMRIRRRTQVNDPVRQRCGRATHCQTSPPLPQSAG